MKPYAEMTIEEFVQSAHIVRNGDKCGSYDIPKGRRDEFMAHLRAVKQQVMEYLISKEKSEEATERERQAKIDAIPGLKELRAAINDERRYSREFSAMMDDEHNDGVFPPDPIKDRAEDVAARFPAAASYIKAEEWSYAAHYVKAGAGKKALERIINGDDHVAVIADMEKEWSDYCNEHIWD